MFDSPDFIYKVTLAPGLVALATLIGRRWGDVAAGLTAGLPIVAGPILFFYALEQGPLYATDAALSNLLGLFCLSIFALAYAWRAWSGGKPLSCVLVGWVGFGSATFLANHFIRDGSPTLLKALVYALLALFLASRSLPPMDAPGIRGKPSAWDVPFRMAAAAILVVVLTRFAGPLGPKLGGLLAVFPVASTVLAVFAHRQGGGEAAVAVLKGLLSALNAFAAFCAVLVLALPRMGLAGSFGLALVAAAVVQAAIVLMRSTKAAGR